MRQRKIQHLSASLTPRPSTSQTARDWSNQKEPIKTLSNMLRPKKPIEYFFKLQRWFLIAKRGSDVMTQTNKPECGTIAFFKHESLQYSKTTFLKGKFYLHSLCFSQYMLMLSERRRVPVICIPFLDFACFAISHYVLSFSCRSLCDNKVSAFHWLSAHRHRTLTCIKESTKCTLTTAKH